MGQILRYAEGRIRVPGDLPESARAILDFWWDDPALDPDDKVGRRRLRSLQTMTPLYRYANGYVLVNGRKLSDVRNMCDTETLASESMCEEYAAEDGRTLEPMELCLTCPWCQALAMRDRIDYWLDVEGVYRNPYIAEGTQDQEAFWWKVWGGEPSNQEGTS